MTNLLTALRRNDISSIQENLGRVSVLSHEDLCFAACHASPEALELCLPFTNPRANQSEAIVWGLKNTANPTRAYDIFCLLRNHCDVQESIGMLEEEWSDELYELFDENQEQMETAKKTLIEWEARAQKESLLQSVGKTVKLERPTRKM